MKRIIGILIFLEISACNQKITQSQIEIAKQEIFRIEKKFEKLASEKGLAEAFSYYADSNAVLSRGGILISGKQNIKNHFIAANLKNVVLKWDAVFVDVSASCDLAYTYGNYTFSAKDAVDSTITSKGIFHTVWKKQSDGDWKFVWD
ncbi:MAG: DUF4440 domain-containing protein [Saprospiraceae bacterium]|nr:DUF4440 domain-containing protein [Saprospiraceae bacterium]